MASFGQSTERRTEVVYTPRHDHTRPGYRVICTESGHRGIKVHMNRMKSDVPPRTVPEIWPVHGDYNSLREFPCPLRLECNDGVGMGQH